MKYLTDIAKIIDSHRAEEFIACPEDCWCWDIEAVIEIHEERLSQQNALLPKLQNINIPDRFC